MKIIKVSEFGGKMYIVAVYDISTTYKKGERRLNKIMKLFRKYLHHTQKSVFEGELSEAKFMALKIKTDKIIDKKEDYVVFFEVENKNNVKREMLGIQFNSTSNLI